MEDLLRIITWIVNWPIQIFSLYFFREERRVLKNKIDDLYKTHCQDLQNSPPPIAQTLLILAEDHRFFSHRGIDPISILRAIWKKLRYNECEGASTIEMQLVRVLTGRYEVTAKRKIKEACLSTLIGAMVPRSDIPAMYLRVAYYGTLMHNFTKACSQLNFVPEKMTVQQAAQLVARIKYPEPRNASNAVLSRIDKRAKYLVTLYGKNYYIYKKKEC